MGKNADKISRDSGRSAGIAAAGVPMRTLQEWMGYRSITTTQRYADYASCDREADMVAAAFARGDNVVAFSPVLT